MSEDKVAWMCTAETARAKGDFKAMRACAREILEAAPGDIDGLCIFAEATLLAGDTEEARKRLVEIRLRSPQYLPGMLAEAELAAAEFRLEEEISLLGGLLAVARENNDPAAADIIFRSLGLLADACSLAGEPGKSAEALFEASVLARTPEEKGELYSKALFMTNFRPLGPEESLKLHRGYNAFFRAKMTFPHRHSDSHGQKLRVGYLSPDFRQHAAANFFTPFLKNFSRDEFVVYAYSTGEKDTVTSRFSRLPANWRDLHGLSAMEMARRIYSDHIDILVDLSGHTQNTCLPVLVYRPAPLQLSGIGYMNTTGLDEVDYFISDKYCLPTTDHWSAFSEKILRPAHSHLCYAPGIVKIPPAPGKVPPSVKNGFITFGCFNKFGKITAEMLRLWRTILEMVPGSRLVLKNKTCSIPGGREIINKRLRAVGINPDRVELRPYSPDYLEQYRDIDIALDTSPYTGGLTTCEALIMGVPVVSLRGNTHGSRFGVSILENADLPELVAVNDGEYIKKAVRLATETEILGRFHAELRGFLQRSPLMDADGYMQDLEAEYHRIWEEAGR